MKGFTLVELIIVVGIIAILAAIAIPNFLNYQCKTKQVEARKVLGAIAKFQETHYANYDVYTTDTSILGIPPKGDRIYYDYEIVSADPKIYTARAIGKTESFKGASEIWTINQSVMLVNVANACTR